MNWRFISEESFPGAPRKRVLECAAEIRDLMCRFLWWLTMKMEHQFLSRTTPCKTYDWKTDGADITNTYYLEKPSCHLSKWLIDRVVLEIQRGCIRGCRFCCKVCFIARRATRFWETKNMRIRCQKHWTWGDFFEFIKLQWLFVKAPVEL